MSQRKYTIHEEEPKIVPIALAQGKVSNIWEKVLIGLVHFAAGKAGTQNTIGKDTRRGERLDLLAGRLALLGEWVGFWLFCDKEFGKGFRGCLTTKVRQYP